MKNIIKSHSSIATSCTSKSLKTSTALAPACSAELTACAQLCTCFGGRAVSRPPFRRCPFRGPKKRGKLAEILGKCQETAEKCGKKWWTNGKKHAGNRKNGCWKSWEKTETSWKKAGKMRKAYEKCWETWRFWKIWGCWKKGWDFVLVGCFRRNI